MFLHTGIGLVVAQSREIKLEEIPSQGLTHSRRLLLSVCVCMCDVVLKPEILTSNALLGVFIQRKLVGRHVHWSTHVRG